MSALRQKQPSQPATTNSRQTTSHSSSLRQSGYGSALMSPSVPPYSGHQFVIKLFEPLSSSRTAAARASLADTPFSSPVNPAAIKPGLCTTRWSRRCTATRLTRTPVFISSIILECAIKFFGTENAIGLAPPLRLVNCPHCGRLRLLCEALREARGVRFSSATEQRIDDWCGSNM